MKKKLITILSAVIFAITQATAAITGDWKLYPSFEETVVHVIETPHYVYFTTYAQAYVPESKLCSEPLMSLFRYDKEESEIQSMTSRNYLSGNLVRSIAYNTEKKYLLVIYDDLNIDFLYEDGKVSNVSTLKAASIPGNHGINSVTFCPFQHMAYIATDFGYVAVDDRKHELAEAHNYGVKVNAIGRVADRLALSTPEGGYVGNIYDRRATLADYTPEPAFDGCLLILPRSNEKGFMLKASKLPGGGSVMSFDFNGTMTVQETNTIYSYDNIQGFEIVEGGLFVRFPAFAILFDRFEREGPPFNLQSEDYYQTCVAATPTRLWVVRADTGLKSFTYDDYRHSTPELRPIRPNAPAPFITYDIINHPTKGMLTGTFGYNGRFLDDHASGAQLSLSGLQNGIWTDYSPRHFDKNLKKLGLGYDGLAYDPNDPKYVYQGSFFHGLARINLDDPSDVLLLGRGNDSPANELPVFINQFETFEAFPNLCRVRSPQFDNKGDLYFSRNTLTGPFGAMFELYRWTAADRKASTSAATYRPLEKVTIDKIKGCNSEVFLVCKVAKNANKFIWAHTSNAGGGGSTSITIYDNGGTFSDKSDDKYVTLNSGYDQDGNPMSTNGINQLYEDPQTGNIWVCTDTGLYTFNITQQSGSTGVFNRIKVARNDGTSLADYLLNEVKVNNMTNDHLGRKWFCTEGGGLVCTSSDGRKILGEFNTENSYLPSDNIFSAAWSPESNSLLMSTESGLAEFYPSGSSTSEDKIELRVYPNPAAPDYYGYVTIDGMPDGSLVKIADSSGALVRDLGIAEGGSIQWDMAGHDGQRVKTGVYRILVSGGPDSQTGSAVGKVLIMN